MPVNVTVVFLARAGDIVRKHFIRMQLDHDDPDLKYLIEEIGKQISPRFYRGVITGRLVFSIFVNGRPVDELSYKLKDGDRIVFTTPEMGG